MQLPTRNRAAVAEKPGDPRHNENQPIGPEDNRAITRRFSGAQVDPRTADNPALPLYSGKQPFFGNHRRARTGNAPNSIIRDSQEVDRR